MLDTSQIISVVLVLGPIIATVPSLAGVFDLSYKDAKQRFQEIGKSLKERKIENWRYVFLGDEVEGAEISVSDEHIGNVLRSMAEGETLYKFLGFCKKSFHCYYVLLLIIFCFGVVHGFFDLIGWFPGLITYVSGYKILIISGTLLYVIVGLVWLFIVKYILEKKYEEYLEI